MNFDSEMDKRLFTNDPRTLRQLLKTRVVIESKAAQIVATLLEGSGKMGFDLPINRFALTVTLNAALRLTRVLMDMNIAIEERITGEMYTVHISTELTARDLRRRLSRPMYLKGSTLTVEPLQHEIPQAA